MALLHCNFFSEVLRLSTSMDVILPQPDPVDLASGAAMTRKYPVLYLLHGLSDDHTIWQRRTSIERYVSGLNLAVVMPAVHRSFYADMASGNQYWTFISQELPALVQAMFPISGAREDTFVAGLSMGGFGAFKWALNQPERFAAAASLSGAVNMANNANHHGDDAWQTELSWMFGDLAKMRGSSNDLIHMAKQVAASDGPKPRLYQWCGTDDFLYEDNIRYRDEVQSLGSDYLYEEGLGAHEWICWDTQIQRVLEWIPLKNA